MLFQTCMAFFLHLKMLKKQQNCLFLDKISKTLKLSLKNNFLVLHLRL